MTSPTPYTILHLPASGIEWAGVLTQFTMRLAAREGRAFAAWAAERLQRATRRGEGLVAMADGQLLGLVLFEISDDTAELTMPWMSDPAPQVARDLVEATLIVLRQAYPNLRHVRAERQLLPGEADPAELQAAGFECHWRRRMILDLTGWRTELHVPDGYRMVPWHIRYLDAAAEVVYRANRGTLDALLYAPFFGESPAQCRKGLLAILAGQYGLIHPRATQCALYGSALVGINLIIDETERLASVVEISVDPDHQGKGLGRALMVRSLQVLREDGGERVELAVTKENTYAAHLYESLGFSEYGTFPVCVLKA